MKSVREKYWDSNTAMIPFVEKPRPDFVFIKTKTSKTKQSSYPLGTRILPLGNYLADDYSVADTIVLDVLKKARADSPLKNIVRESYDEMELRFFDSPYSQAIGKAHERAKMDKKLIDDTDLVKTKVILGIG